MEGVYIAIIAVSYGIVYVAKTPDVHRGAHKAIKAVRYGGVYMVNTTVKYGRVYIAIVAFKYGSSNIAIIRVRYGGCPFCHNTSQLWRRLCSHYTNQVSRPLDRQTL
jgi:hypothetical protein